MLVNYQRNQDTSISISPKNSSCPLQVMPSFPPAQAADSSWIFFVTIVLPFHEFLEYDYMICSPLCLIAFTLHSDLRFIWLLQVSLDRFFLLLKVFRWWFNFIIAGGQHGWVAGVWAGVPVTRKVTAMTSPRASSRGLQFTLGTSTKPVIVDTIVMANLVNNSTSGGDTESH